MKRYHFPLRPVRVLRAHEEMRAREVFAAAVQAYVTAEDNLAIIRGRKAHLETVLADGMRLQTHATEAIAALQAYRCECDEETKAEEAATTAREEMNAKREEYTTAHRALKGINRLEEKSLIAYRRECDRATQAELDDLSSHRHIRRQADLAR